MADANEILIGRRLTRATAAGFAFGHWISPKNAEEIRPHGHEAGHFVFVAEGEFTTDAEGGRDDRPLLIYNPPGTYHRDRFESGGAFFSVHVPADANEALHEYSLPKVPTLISGGQAAVRRLMRECADWGPDSEFVSEAACLELLGQAGRARVAGAAEPAWLAKARDLLMSVEPAPASIESIARTVGIHSIHLTRTFRRFLGCTPGDYLRSVRLNRAAGLLRSTKRSIAELALESGFADQSHLTRNFRRAFGVGPGKFRQMLS